MKRCNNLFLAAILIVASSQLKSQQVTCKTGGFSLGYEYHMPVDKNLISNGAFTMDIFFLKKYTRTLNYSFGVEMNAGSKKYNKVIENIKFEGDYMGYADYSMTRFGVWGKFMIAKQIKNIVEITVPLKIGYRAINYKQFFELYEGQEIREEDMADENTNDENTNKFAKNKKMGLGIGLNLAFFPSSGISPFIEFNYNYYGKITHQDIVNATINNGTINIPTYNAPNSSNYSFRAGVRFNFGRCPKEIGDIYNPNGTHNRNAPNYSHPTVETEIIDRSIDTKPNETDSSPSSNEPSTETGNTKPNVILKPKVEPKKPKGKKP